MKKTGIILASVLGVLLLAAWIVPMFFRDKIIARLQQEINNRVNATVSFRPEKVSLSLLRHFPNLTLQTDSLRIVGQTPFRGDTLLSARRFEASVNLLSAFSGDKLKLKGVYLDQPRILVKILRDGRANYDIYKVVESNEPVEADTSQTAFTVDIDEWEIKNGLIRYEDLSLPLSVLLESVDHTGSGSLSAELADLALTTKAERVTLAYDGMEYLTDKKLDAEMGLRADFEKAVYTFAENRIRLNDLPIELNGSIGTGTSADTSMRFDLSFRSPEGDFKNLLSLVPGIYSERFQGIEADGTVRFDGNVKGPYNGRQIPAFLLNLAVSEGRFKYPNLPSAVENIGVDLTVSNPTDRLNNTVINLKKLVADVGHNPIRGRALVRGLTRSAVDADVTAKLNLAELTQLFPIDSLMLKGLADLSIKAKGVYDKTAKLFPVVNALMRLQNGYARSKAFPEPIEDINALATLTNSSGQLADTRLAINDLRLKLAGDPFQANGWVQNFEDYNFDLTAKGRLNLTNLTRIFPIEGTQLAGLIDANLETKGRVSDAKAKRFERLPTRGTMAVTNLHYKGEALPQGLTLNSARLNLSPGKLDVQQAQGVVGTSSFTADGFLSNYIAFLLGENQPLEGQLQIRANRLNINDWMSDDPQPTPQTARPSVIEIPKNIQVAVNAVIDQAVYDKMPLNNVKGQLEVADGQLRMKQLTFTSLGGQFITNGTYDPTNLAKPRFAFDMKIANADVSQAYRHLTLAKVIFPLAQYVVGRFSTQFAVNGRLEPDMMPDLNSLTGNGLVELIRATLKNNPVLDRLFEKTKLADLRNPNFKDLLMKVEVKNGFVSIKPFDVKIKDNIVNVSGSNSLEGDLKYTLKLDVPTGQAGVQFTRAFSSLTGQSLENTERAKMDFALNGNYKKPQIRFLGGNTVDEVRDAVVKRAKNDLKEQGLKLLQKLAKSPKDST